MSDGSGSLSKCLIIFISSAGVGGVRRFAARIPSAASPSKNGRSIADASSARAQASARLALFAGMMSFISRGRHATFRLYGRAKMQAAPRHRHACRSPLFARHVTFTTAIGRFGWLARSARCLPHTRVSPTAPPPFMGGAPLEQLRC